MFNIQSYAERTFISFKIDQDADKRWEDLLLVRSRHKTLSEDEWRLEDEAQTQTQQS